MVRRLDVDVLSVVRGLNAIWTGTRADPAASCAAVSLPRGSANPRGVVRFGLLPVIIGIGFPVAAAWIPAPTPGDHHGAFSIDREHTVITVPPPLLGGSTVAVLQEYGHGDQEIRQMSEDGDTGIYRKAALEGTN